MRAQSSRLGVGTEAAEDIRGAASKPILPTASSARIPRAQYAVHVLSTRRDGVQVGQTFATIQAAEKKVRRCEAAGLPVQVALVRLVPVPWSVIGGGPL